MARDPYRIFFPLGLLLAWAGVAHWFLHAIGVLEDFRPIFHAMTQVQGFLTSFAVGFLFTMLPRRTGSAPPATWQLAIGISSPVAITIASWFDLFALSQAIWIALMLMMLGFVLPRFRKDRARRRPPNSFVWIPVAFALGIVGSSLTGIGAALGHEHWWLHELGRRLVLQGVFLSLVLGAGGLAIPLMTRGEAPRDATLSRRDRIARALHLAAAIGICASFAIEEFLSLRGALFLRGAIVLSVLIGAADIARSPVGPGLNRRLIWLSAWMLPLGYLLAGIFDEHARAGLHVAFIGGFAMMTLAVSAHVSLAHGGLGRILSTHPLRLILLGVLLLVAAAARFTMDFDPDRYFVWMAIASFSFLAATIAWAALVVPAAVQRDGVCSWGAAKNGSKTTA